MEGLGATLTSLIRNCSQSKTLKLWFLCSELGENDKRNIQQLLKAEAFEGELKFIDFDAKKKFGHLTSLHGDWTTYGRLLIPDIIESDTAVYLDSDLIINIDILEFNSIKIDKILSAVNGSEILYTLDGTFLIEKLNLAPDTLYFNAGVLIFNISSWKANNSKKRLEEIANQYSNELVSGDQTLLNALCAGDFTHLPKKFNSPWYPGSPQPQNMNKEVVHFVGSPKPWDFFGKIIHSGRDTWNAYTPPFWKSQYSGISALKISRTWKIRRSIFKHLKQKLLSK